VRVEKDYKLEKLRLKFVAEKEKRLGTIDERLKEIDKLEAELKIVSLFHQKKLAFVISKANLHVFCLFQF
jgi:hypothetical protein